MNAAHESAVDVVPDARLLGRERALARDEPDLHAQELVEDRAAVCGRSSSRHRLGPVDGAQRGVAVDEVVPVEERLVERIGEAARLRTWRSASATSARQLPREHLGFARLRVDGHDHAGLVVGDARRGRCTSTTGFVIWRLPRYTSSLPKNDASVPTAQLLLAPRLVEERDVQQRRAVVDDRLDECAALARAAAVDLRTSANTVASSPTVSSAMSACLVRSTQRRG